MGSSNSSPPPPEYDRPWRSINWSEDGQKLLKTVTNFQPGNQEVNPLRILLHGPVGAGKSSFFNSVNSALQGYITTRALANSSLNAEKTFTVQCKTYKVKNERAGSFLPFAFTDIAGMDKKFGIKTDDIIQLLNGHINDGYTFNPVKPITDEDPKYNNNPILKDKIHCLVAVLPANTVSMINEEMIWQMREVREKARDLGIPQAIVMTKVDEACPLVKKDLKKIYTSKKIKQKMEECSNKLGVPVSCIYPVKNYHEENNTNTTADILILDALKNILNFANDYVEDQVLRNATVQVDS
ncbi:interferon-induced protein 44 isoform X2 [Megalobrama amblycephala]|uniref:interferon-induced protein 44 isoform X2 n=1 Tax=Megalobrama amblycephala TaxID=75352 RepID=UPI002013FAC7|nr:interferon-induced protein 44 isoform X2 [Megalobrama amblycephala]